MVCVTVAGLAAPASAQRGGSAPTLLSKQKVDWIAGTSEWINLSWTSTTQLDNFEVRVVRQSRGLTVEYPNGADHSSLMIDSTLSPNEVDFTALKVTTDAEIRGTQRAMLEITWDQDGREQKANGWIRFTNKAYQGEDFAILTEEVSVSDNPVSPADNWVDFAYKGLAPMTSQMQITASGPVPIHHPQDTFTSLHHDQTLHAGESDVARVWFDPELLEAGTQMLDVTIDYVDTNGNNRQATHQVKLVVTPGA